MSGTATVPRGLDTMDAADQALYESMRDETPAPEIEVDAPAAVETPALEADADDGADDIDISDEPAAPTPPKTKTVPHAQFHAANERRKAAEAKATEAIAKAAAAEAQLAQDRAVLQARIDTIARLVDTGPAAAPAPVASEVPALPDVNTDPVGYFKAIADQSKSEISSLKGMIQGFQEQQRAAQQQAEMRNWATAQETAFMSKEPDYVPAMDHLRQRRNAQLVAVGITDPVERDRIIRNDVSSIAWRAKNEGADFAERMFKVAESYGYAKPAPPEPAAPVIPPMDAEPAPVADRAVRSAAARENATTIGSLGAAPPTRLSPDKIANLSDSEFAALTERLRARGGSALRDLMGH